MPPSALIGKDLIMRKNLVCRVALARLLVCRVARARLLVLFGLLSLSASAAAYENTSSNSSLSKQYTFAWPYAEKDAMSPRGGTTRGAAVELLGEPTPAWNALQAAKGVDKDRAAILAMAGSFRASFDFVEVAGFTPDYKPARPYQSWGTERVVVLASKPDFISLQHVLVMRMIGADGKASAPMVTKHWRQDWQWQPRARFDYQGQHRWAGSSIESEAGSWSQCVYQVDDSPRYCGVGRWQHSANYSSWLSDEGARPLPRREWSVRKDYALLLGHNRHTITPTGWIHEQQNNKVSDFDAQTTIAREFGLNRYEAIRDPLDEAERYVKATEALWREVRAQWQTFLQPGRSVRLKGAPDEAQLFMPLFEEAAALEKDPKRVVTAERVKALLDGYFAPEPEPQAEIKSKAIAFVEQALPKCNAPISKECDRAAIKAMAGDFAVSFNFDETVIIDASYRRHAPMRSNAYEQVRVIEDSPEKISLQHILVSDSGRVVKHWRQDWLYQASEYWVYAGDQRFTPKPRTEAIEGSWTQLVYDVADAPRYAGSGRWNHKYGVSTWTSDRTWRPLPRREYTQRQDYQLINAENRHTVTPSGWTHEQDNSKVVRAADSTDRTLVREFGFNDYRRIEGFDFAPAQAYWSRTEGFWKRVRQAWDGALTTELQLCYSVNDEQPGQDLIKAADSANGDYVRTWMQQHVNCAAKQAANAN
jgi:hypothetical protein